VADITDGSGQFVISQYMKGHKCADRTSTWEWPSQLRLSAVAWNLWRNFNHQMSLHITQISTAAQHIRTLV